MGTEGKNTAEDDNVDELSDAIRLGSSTFEALVSETRVEILKSLGERRKTVSELSEELDLAKSTVHEHLGKLTEAGLVEPDEDHRKWVYYDLTERGEGILQSRSEGRRFLMLISTSLLSLLLAAASGLLLLQNLGNRQGQAFASKAPGEGDASIETVPRPTDTPPGGAESIPTETPVPTEEAGDLLTEAVSWLATWRPGLLVATGAALLVSGATAALALEEYRRRRMEKRL